MASPAYPVTAPAGVRRALLTRQEIALLDVRPESEFAQGHPLFAASFPLGRLAALAAERLPRPGVPVVVYGDGAYDTSDGSDPAAEAAAARLRALGFGDVSVLAGGLAGWAASGGELFRDVNVPSKAFGELVAERAGTPLLAAKEVAELLGHQAGDGAPAVVVVDARRFDEYATMSIPTATSVPGAELVLRVRELAPDPATTVIVNCAGRTRSIIGAQSLINAGLPNRVAALRNGTIGWTLAGLELDHGQARRAPAVPAAAADQAATAAWLVAERAGVRRADGAEGAALDEGGTRTVYRFDVRTPEEYAAGHRPGFRSAPGGQLVQETDSYAPVRGALLVLADDGAGRAAMTGSWLAQMGWDVIVAAPPPGEPAAEPAAHARESAGGAPPPPAVGVYRRPYEGTDVPHAVMQAYLDWEYGLVAQLERDGTHGFRVLLP